MSYNTFRILFIAVVIVLVIGMGYCTKQVFFSGSSSTTSTSTSQPAPQTYPQTQPVQQQQQRTSSSASTEQIKSAVDQWLASNPDRQGKTKLVDALPSQSFKVTFVRFPDADAVKFSDNPSQWSQVRIDVNRDGRDDEKWLLKNGRTYKREVIDGSGRVVETKYF